MLFFSGKLFTINATILDKEGKIELLWGVRCFDRNVTLRRFEIVYHNLQILGEDCYGDVHIDFEQNTKVKNSKEFWFLERFLINMLINDLQLIFTLQV